MSKVSKEYFPAAFAAMDAEASAFWAYPDAEWQENFLRQWAEAHDHQALIAALSGMF